MDPNVPLNAGNGNKSTSTNGASITTPISAETNTTLVEIPATDKSESAEASSTTTRTSLIKRFRRAYGAALVVTGIGFPIIASAITIIFHFLAPDPAWFAPLWGLVSTYVLWFITALPVSYFASAKGANTGSYSEIKTRLSQLKARLDNQPEAEPGDTYNQIAWREAQELYANVDGNLQKTSNGLQWILGTGYLNTWSLIHRIEEALIEVEPTEIVVRGALHDSLCIHGSTITNRDELLEKLERAVKNLDPLAKAYFTEHQLEKHHQDLLMQQNEILAHLVRVIGKNDSSIQKEISPQSNTNSEVVANSVLPPGPDVQANARIVLREVRRTLNDFRDNLWEKVVKARNHLLGAIFLTGFFTQILLTIVLLTSDSRSKESLLAATAFYMVGAVAGLFSRLYGESRTKAVADDYGLSLARLIATPLLSGLAGVGGVLVYGTLFVVHDGASLPTLQGIFSLHQLSYLIAAAIFGLTPNLIIMSLQKQADKYLSGLRYSKEAEEELILGKD